MRLDPAGFDRWFRELSGLKEPAGPFGWQRRLFREWLCPEREEEARWPRLIQLPTACGKTALLDLAVLALAAGSGCARRRIVFVVDRRVVVDEAAERANGMAKRLARAVGDREDPLYEVASALASLGGEKPLVVARLRGGVVGDDGWARSPAQPAIVLSTVDQAGSRLLFRAYGGYSPRSWPIQAGLLGKDTVMIVDEAHCAAPFCETARAIAERWQHFAERPVGAGLEVVRMSATPGEDAEFALEEEDWGEEALQARLRARKKAKLAAPIEAREGGERQRLAEALAAEAEQILKTMRSGVVGVVVNRVRDARSIFERLKLDGERKLLLTGRVRGWERDRLLKEWLPRMRAGMRVEGGAPMAVVATQCIEVGANLDFDYLVTEIAPLDSLRQRFGRVDRLGEREKRRAALGQEAETPGVVVATSRQVEAGEDGGAKHPDRVYGDAISRTWAWLQVQAGGEAGSVDFGIEALEPAMPEGEELKKLCQETLSAYPLLPAHLDMLTQTSPAPEVEPEIAAFLHGTTQGRAEVTVVWRSDLPEGDRGVWAERTGVQPPVTGEGCPVPIWEFRRWMAGQLRVEDGGDLEGSGGEEEVEEVAGERPVLRWRGMSEAEVILAREVRPGDTVVVPAKYGGCDEYGWNPARREAVADIGDAVAFTAGRRAVLRLEAARSWLERGSEVARVALEGLQRWAAGEEDAPEAGEILRRLAEDDSAPEWMKGVAKVLASDGRRRLVVAAGAYAIAGRRGAGEDLGTGEDGCPVGGEVSLSEHSGGVRKYAERFAEAAGVPEDLVPDLALAGWWHDVGKADPRFQVWLHGGNEMAAALADEPLAKSGENARNRGAIRRARERSGYPKDARHEVQSLALIANEEAIRREAHDWDLVQHLVVSHHGHGRPFVPVVRDGAPVSMEVTHGGVRVSGRSDHGLERLDSEIAERYSRLLRRYGWWGLAWLEAILRLADHRRSREEERGEVEGV